MGPRFSLLGSPRSRNLGWLRLLVGLAVVASVLFATDGKAVARHLPATLADQRPAQAAPVEPGFPIQYLGVVWESADQTGLPVRVGPSGEPNGAVRFRHDGVWGPWTPLIADDLLAPGHWGSTLVPGGDAGAYQLRGIPGGVVSPRVVALNTTDGPPITVGYRRSGASALTPPSCRSRAEWGADETLRFVDGLEDWPATFEPVRVMTVHHTATTNNDPAPDATVRAIYYYHTVTNGWGDIAYQYLIDESGVVYEGRWSGEASAPCGDDVMVEDGAGWDFGHDETGELVTAGHTYCYNRGNLGVALLGNFTRVLPTAPARDTLEFLLAENARRHDLDPLGIIFYEAPNDMAACASTVDATIEAIAAHTDWPDPAGATACPGRKFYREMPTVRANVALLLDPQTPPSTTTIPPNGDISLSVITRIERAVRYADLTWSGATTPQVDIWRSGTKVSTTANDGAYTDDTGSNKIKSATYQVCEEGTTSYCSEVVTVSW